MATSPASRTGRGARRRAANGLAVLGFLLPNLVGFLLFTLFPVLFSLWMAFTNWTPKPAVRFAYLGLRNFTDLLAVTPINRPRPMLAWTYGFSLVALCTGAIGMLLANGGGWRGSRLSGAMLAALGLGIAAAALAGAGDQAILLTGAGAFACGLALARRENQSWSPGPALVPAILLWIGAVAYGFTQRPMWQTYAVNDARFWQFAGNTLYLMLGIPLSIAGSLILALLLSDDLKLGIRSRRLTAAALCLAGGLLAALALSAASQPDIGLAVAIAGGIAALGFAFNVVAFRTLFYLPTFTAGVALMILWKALYNPQTGPINAGLRGAIRVFGLHTQPPEWLSSVTWAKPALIAMGVWTGIGGTNMLLYLAGLANVPQELIDAAEVDGANGWNRFRHVTWPQLAPTTFFISIMSIIGGLQGGFEQARVMTNGGPAGATTTLSYYIYNKAFQDLDLGYAAAISWTLFVAVFIATALNWRFGRGLEIE